MQYGAAVALHCSSGADPEGGYKGEGLNPSQTDVVQLDTNHVVDVPTSDTHPTTYVLQHSTIRVIIIYLFEFLC